MKFTSETLFKEVIDNLKARGACQKAIDWSNLADSHNLTFGQLLGKYLEDDSATPSWAIYCLSAMYDDLDKALRLRFIDKIKNTRLAFHTYITQSKLTDEEDVKLKNIFGNKLPSAEKELKDGKIKRKKDGSN